MSHKSPSLCAVLFPLILFSPFLRLHSPRRSSCGVTDHPPACCCFCWVSLVDFLIVLALPCFNMSVLVLFRLLHLCINIFSVKDASFIFQFTRQFFFTSVYIWNTAVHKLLRQYFSVDFFFLFQGCTVFFILYFYCFISFIFVAENEIFLIWIDP